MSNLNDGGIAAESICKYIIGGDKAVRRGRLLFVRFIGQFIFYLFIRTLVR